MGIWGILIFGLIGATATTLAVGHMRQMADWFSSQITRSKSWKGGSGRSYRSSFQEEAWKRYNRRMQEEFEDEMERVTRQAFIALLVPKDLAILVIAESSSPTNVMPVSTLPNTFKSVALTQSVNHTVSLEKLCRKCIAERIRRMQSVFNREKNKFNRGYESWKENNNAGGGYHQHFQRNDWYWKTDTSHGNRSNFKESPRSPVNYALSHHYAILGLSRSRTQPYTDDEIKTAFRSKAKQFHPDQNQQNKDVAEARFKEVMTSYEAIKTERKNMK
ncbi:DnaJ domain-containing protein [Tanacetum coccineum]|uniref:DnaJ domain-containing protein n=1 Tax=Tanacetum coccineum TaxID=301880 RepID=A0ABQ5BB83_9ASTR